MEFVKNTLIRYQHGLNDRSWNALVVENHDLGRCINRFGDLNYYEKSAKAIAVMNFLLKGTPFIYQGQEIGMTNIPIYDINDYDDVEVHGFYKDYVLEQKVLSHEEFLYGCNKEARDNNRTPLQWDGSINAGWNDGAKPWLKINPNYDKINAELEIKDEDSIFNFYKKLIKLRKDPKYVETFVYGKFKERMSHRKNIFMYTRSTKTQKLLVVTNMRDNKECISLPRKIKKTLLSNYGKEYTGGKVTLEPFESFVIEI
jgi:glycosidase